MASKAARLKALEYMDQGMPEEKATRLAELEALDSPGDNYGPLDYVGDGVGRVLNLTGGAARLGIYGHPAVRAAAMLMGAKPENMPGPEDIQRVLTGTGASSAEYKRRMGVPESLGLPDELALSAPGLMPGALKVRPNAHAISPLAMESFLEDMGTDPGLGALGKLQPAARVTKNVGRGIYRTAFPALDAKMAAENPLLDVGRGGQRATDFLMENRVAGTPAQMELQRAKAFQAATEAKPEIIDAMNELGVPRAYQANESIRRAEARLAEFRNRDALPAPHEVGNYSEKPVAVEPPGLKFKRDPITGELLVDKRTGGFVIEHSNPQSHMVVTSEPAKPATGPIETMQDRVTRERNRPMYHDAHQLEADTSAIQQQASPAFGANPTERDTSQVLKDIGMGRRHDTLETIKNLESHAELPDPLADPNSLASRYQANNHTRSKLISLEDPLQGAAESAMKHPPKIRDVGGAGAVLGLGGALGMLGAHLSQGMIAPAEGAALGMLAGGAGKALTSPWGRTQLGLLMHDASKLPLDALTTAPATRAYLYGKSHPRWSLMRKLQKENQDGQENP